MEAVGPKAIVSFSSNSLQINFKKFNGKIFAERIFNGKLEEYPIDLSLSVLRASSVSLYSPSKKVKWLLNNQYVPFIQNGKIVFQKVELSEVTDYNRIGCGHYHRGEYSKAIEYFQKVLQIQQKALSENHPDIAKTYNNIGCAYRDNRKYEQALEFHQKALKIRLKSLGEGHPDVVTSYSHVRQCMIALGKIQDPTQLHLKKPKDSVVQPIQATTTTTTTHAIASKQAISFTRFFPQATVRIEMEDPNSQDIEGQYFTCLNRAKKQDFIEEQIFYLKELSDLYIQKKNFLVAAKILNCAIAIVPEQYSSLKEEFFAQLKSIEDLFVESLTIEPAKRQHSIIRNRDSLQTIRAQAALASEKQEPIQEILGTMTKGFQTILVALIHETMDILGEPPVDWACIGMGSMARGEMCPYSDVEFAFLIEQDTSEAMEYFRTLSKILELKIINLGETKFPVFGWGYKSPTPDGFCMDSGGNTPLGKPGLYELIGTPAQLAQFQSEKWIEGDIILPNVLSHVCLVEGNPDLVSEYDREKEQVQQMQARQQQGKQTNKELLALRLIAGHLHEFRPDLSKEKEESKEFNVKKELYRPFQEIVSSLAIFYRLTAKSTFDRIDELLKMDIFSARGAENLKKTIDRVLFLRLQVQLFYKNEEENLCHSEEDKPQDSTLLYINEERIEDLHQIYQVLLPFHRCTCNFWQTQDVTLFRESEFFDDRPEVRGKAFEKTFQYDKACEAFQQAISLNPNNFWSVLDLANIQSIQGEDKASLSRKLEALEIANDKYGEQEIWSIYRMYSSIGYSYELLGDIGNALKYYTKSLEVEQRIVAHLGVRIEGGVNIGDVLYRLGQYKDALEYYEKQLQMKQKLRFISSPSSLAIIYYNLGRTHRKLKNYSQALECHEKALDLLQKERNPRRIGGNYNALGLIYYDLADYEKAFDFFNKALSIFLELFGDNHPEIASIYNNLGLIFSQQGEYSKAHEYHEKVLEYELKQFGKDHPGIATTYNNIAGVYDDEGNYEKAIVYYNKALEILTNVLKNHPDVASVYSNLARMYDKLEKYKKAIELYENSLKISIQFFGEQSLELVMSYNNIGMNYAKLKEYKNALSYLKKALEIRIENLGENHVDLVETYNNIGSTYSNCEGSNDSDSVRYEKALEHHQKALDIQIKIFGEVHLDVVETYVFMANVYLKKGETSRAISLLEKVIDIQMKVLGRNDLEVARSYVFIGVIYTGRRENLTAISHFDKAFEIMHSALGDDHPTVAELYILYGKAYFSLGDEKKALEYFLKAFEIGRKVVVDNPLILIGVCKNMAMIYSDLGEVRYLFSRAYDRLSGITYPKQIAALTESIKYQEIALEVLLNIFNKDSLEIAESYSELSKIYHRLAKINFNIECYKKARDWSKKALSSRKAILGEDAIDLANDYDVLGQSYYKLAKTDYLWNREKRNNNALESYGEALRIRLQVTGVGNSNRARSLSPVEVLPSVLADNYHNVGRCYERLGQYEESLRLYNQAVQVFQSVRYERAISRVYIKKWDIRKAIGEEYDDNIEGCNSCRIHYIFCCACFCQWDSTFLKTMLPIGDDAKREFYSPSHKGTRPSRGDTEKSKLIDTNKEMEGFI